MNDNVILKPANQCSLTSIERSIWFDKDTILLQDDNFRLRIVKYVSGKPSSALLLEPYGKNGYVIRLVYTTPSKRLKGLAKGLLALARTKCKNVRHSNNLTLSGLAWQNAVEGL